MSKVVRLSNLRFAERWRNDPTLRSGEDIRFTEQESTEPRHLNAFGATPRVETGFQYDPNDTSKPTSLPKFKSGDSFYDRLSKDAPGEELSHGATLWNLYLDEAGEYDQELVKGRHDSLDVLLLFAALFSAILTAFLIESKNMLQRDTTDDTITLLLLIARNGVGAGSTPSSTVELPAFTPATSALWINGLWFAALALSLAAALIAMLSKEWLTAYTASRPRPAHTHALLRQARLDGLGSWWALHVIALLPTLLHLALLLFALGLVVYLWTLEVVVAGITGAIVALTVLFYLGTTMLGALVPHCPFVTEISKYIQQMGGAKLGVWMRLKHRGTASGYNSPAGKPHEVTTLEDIKAISWLAENARDPVAIDCAYQALAGIHIPADSDTSDPAPPKDSATRWYKSLDHLFPTLLARFGGILNNEPELAASRGVNAARYARALVEIVTFFSSQDKTQRSGAHVDKGGLEPHTEKNSRPDLKVLALPSFSDSITLLSIRRHAELVLKILAGVWRDDHPPFSADAFACLTAAELRLVVLAVESLEIEQSAVSNPPGIPMLETPENVTSEGPSATDESPTTTRVTLSSLQATYTRSLIRASIQLRYHSDGRTPVGPFALASLLDAIRLGASCVALNPEVGSGNSVISRSQPQNSNSISFPSQAHTERAKLELQTNFIVPVFSFDHYLRPTDLTRGPLGCIIRVLSTTNIRTHSAGDAPTSHTKPRPQMRMVGARALAAVAPVALNRWLAIKVSRNGADTNVDHRAPSSTDPLVWPDIASDLDAPRLENAIATQLLFIIRTVGPHLARAGAISLMESVLAELNRIADESPYSAFMALRHLAQYSTFLLEYASGNTSEGGTGLGLTAKAHLINLLTFEATKKQQIRRTYLPAHCIPHLLQTLRDVPGKVPLARAVFKYVVDRVRDTGKSVEYLQCFINSDQGFSSLVSIGVTHEEYIELVVNTILQITHIAASNGPNARNAQYALSASAISGFLDAISLVARHTVEVTNKQNHRHLHTFGRNVVAVLYRVDPSTAQIVLEHGALDEVMAALQAHDTRSNSIASVSGSGSGTGRSAVPISEYLFAQLRSLKEEQLPELASKIDERGGDEQNEGQLSVYAI